MRLLIVSINYDPEAIGIAAYSTGMADYLSTSGDKVDVITALPYYPGWQTFEGWRRPFWKSRTGQSGTRIVHCPIYVPSNPTGAKRILHHLTFALSSLPVLLWKCLMGRPQAVIVVAPSLISAPSSCFCAWLCRAKTWLHIQDFEVEAAFATGLLSSESRMGRLALKFERWVLGRFDMVSSISSRMTTKVSERGVPKSKVFELRNWANLANVSPLSAVPRLKAELEIETRFVALYSGNLANKQGLEILPEAARHLVHRDDLTFVICGDGPMKKPLQAMSQDLRNIRFLPLQPLEKLNDLLGMADVHLLPQIEGAADLVLPSKLTNMLASGRPVIATAPVDSALADEVDGAGVVVPPGDGLALAQAVDDIFDDAERRSEYGHVARQRALERWDMDAILTAFHLKLSRLTGQLPAPDTAIKDMEEY